MFETLYEYPTLTLNTFAEFFYAVYSYTWWQWLLLLGGLVLLFIFASMLIGKIEAHFRTGKFDLGWHNSRGLNYNLIEISKALILMLVASLIINLLTILLMFLTHFILSINGIMTTTGVVIIWIIGVINILLQARVSTYFMLAGLDSIIMGSPYTVALGNASLAIAKNFWDIFFAELVPFAFAVIITILGCFLGVTWLTNIISILVLFPYIAILGMVNIFDYYGITRYDNRKYYLR